MEHLISEVHLLSELFGCEDQPNIHSGAVGDGSPSPPSLVLVLGRRDLPQVDSDHVTGPEHLLDCQPVVFNLLGLVVEEHGFELQLWLLLTESVLDPPDWLVLVHPHLGLSDLPLLNVYKINSNKTNQAKIYTFCL